MSNTDKERWKTLFSSINEITTQQSSLNSKFQVTNNILDSINTKLVKHESRMRAFEVNIDRLFKPQRDKNIVLIRLEDSDDVNNHLIEVI